VLEPEGLLISVVLKWGFSGLAVFTAPKGKGVIVSAADASVLGQWQPGRGCFCICFHGSGGVFLTMLLKKKV